MKWSTAVYWFISAGIFQLGWMLWAIPTFNLRQKSWPEALIDWGATFLMSLTIEIMFRQWRRWRWDVMVSNGSVVMLKDDTLRARLQELTIEQVVAFHEWIHIHSVYVRAAQKFEQFEEITRKEKQRRLWNVSRPLQ